MKRVLWAGAVMGLLLIAGAGCGGSSQTNEPKPADGGKAPPTGLVPAGSSNGANSGPSANPPPTPPKAKAASNVP